MELLLLPEDRPAYRADRSHGAFLTRLKDHVGSPDSFFAAVKHRLRGLFDVEEATSSELVEVFQRSNERKTNRLVDVAPYAIEQQKHGITSEPSQR